MKFQTEVTVTGMKPSKGDFEGTSYDSTKVYVETELSPGKGSATVEYTFGKSDEYAKFEHLPFPFVAVADMEIVTSGKAQKTVITGLKPKQVAPSNKAPAAA